MTASQREDAPVSSSEEACLYALLTSKPESHDRLLLELVAPIVRRIGNHADLDSLFFVRYADPEWQLRFRILGRRGWIEDAVHPDLDSAIRPFQQAGLVTAVQFGEYAREWERYGGERGMRLAEKIFSIDSQACLDVLELERAGSLGRSRREYSLAFTERFLDLFAFDREQRREFYREGYAWAFRDGVFREEDRPRLAKRYDGNREGLRELLETLGGDDPSPAFGGVEAWRVARRCLDATRPIVEELRAAHEAGEIRQRLVYLAWSYAHLHCNRLGVDLVPEAILRYLMSRLYEEDATASA